VRSRQSSLLLLLDLGGRPRLDLTNRISCLGWARRLLVIVVALGEVQLAHRLLPLASFLVVLAAALLRLPMFPLQTLLALLFHRARPGRDKPFQPV
jgi:hypothetical protein